MAHDITVTYRRNANWVRISFSQIRQVANSSTPEMFTLKRQAENFEFQSIIFSALVAGSTTARMVMAGQGQRVDLPESLGISVGDITVRAATITFSVTNQTTVKIPMTLSFQVGIRDTTSGYLWVSSDPQIPLEPHG